MDVVKGDDRKKNRKLDLSIFDESGGGIQKIRQIFQFETCFLQTPRKNLIAGVPDEVVSRIFPILNGHDDANMVALTGRRINPRGNQFDFQSIIFKSFDFYCPEMANNRGNIPKIDLPSCFGISFFHLIFIGNWEILRKYERKCERNVRHFGTGAKKSSLLGETRNETCFCFRVTVLHRSCSVFADFCIP